MLIRAVNIAKSFGSLREGRVSVLENAAIEIGAGETVGLVGESGSGKTTLGRILVGLIRADRGTIEYDGRRLGYPFQKDIRRNIQILFQQPEVSFNPRLPLVTSLMEPYRLLGKRIDRASLLRNIERFGLYEEHLDRFPAELSGGELQRAALARILVLRPTFIVLDEPTSMLDAISQAQMIELLLREQEENGTAYLFISHNVELARLICRRVMAMEEGHVIPLPDIASGQPDIRSGQRMDGR